MVRREDHEGSECNEQSAGRVEWEEGDAPRCWAKKRHRNTDRRGLTQPDLRWDPISFYIFNGGHPLHKSPGQEGSRASTNHASWRFRVSGRLRSVGRNHRWWTQGQRTPMASWCLLVLPRPRALPRFMIQNFLNCLSR